MEGHGPPGAPLGRRPWLENKIGMSGTGGDNSRACSRVILYKMPSVSRAGRTVRDPSNELCDLLFRKPWGMIKKKKPGECTPHVHKETVAKPSKCKLLLHLHIITYPSHLKMKRAGLFAYFQLQKVLDPTSVNQNSQIWRVQHRSRKYLTWHRCR